MAVPSPAPRGRAPRAWLVWPVEAWPEIDRRLWLAGLATPAGDDDGLGDGPATGAYAAGLAETTVKNARLGYGRWLAALAAAGELDPAVPPAARATKARAKLYLRTLRSCGNTNHTLRERLRALHRALRILQPEAAAELGWLTARLGLLPVTLRPVRVYDSAALEAWAHERRREALAQPQPQVRQAQYRDGLLIAILATRVPRLRSLAAMRLGQHVVREADGKGWRLAFAAQDVKTRRPIEYALPASLVPCIDRYLAVERPELLQGRRHDWFWVDCDGERLAAPAISRMIRKASQARFGAVFGPHRFRHSLATTAARADPANPGLAASVLAISEPVVEAHYNRARQEEAARRFQETLREHRARTAAPQSGPGVGIPPSAAALGNGRPLPLQREHASTNAARAAAMWRGET